MTRNTGPAFDAHPVSKSPLCGGASGVNRQRSGLRSISGVLSRQSRPLTLSVAPSRATSVASAVPIGFGRTGERSENVPRVAPSLAGTLAHEVAARLVQPIENLDPLERFDPVERCDPRLVDFNPADRPVGSPLPGTVEARRPRRSDHADEGKAGVERLGRFDRDFVCLTSFSLTMIRRAPTRAPSTMLRMVPLPRYAWEDAPPLSLLLPCACKARGRGTARRAVEGARLALLFQAAFVSTGLPLLRPDRNSSWVIGFENIG